MGTETTPINHFKGTRLFIPDWFFHILPVFPFIVYGLVLLMARMGWLNEGRFDPSKPLPLWYIVCDRIGAHPWEVMGIGGFCLAVLSRLILGEPLNR